MQQVIQNKQVHISYTKEAMGIYSKLENMGGKGTLLLSSVIKERTQAVALSRHVGWHVYDKN